MPAIFFALASFLGWGIGDVFGTAATRKLGTFSVTFWSIIFSLILLSLYAPLAPGNITKADLDTVLLTLGLGTIGILGLLAFNEGLRIGNASLVGTIAASFSALVVVFSVIFLGESLNLPQAIAILTIFSGVLLATFDLKEVKKGKIINRGTLFALMAMFAWGVWFTFIKIPVQKIGWFWPIYLGWLPGLVIILLLKGFGKMRLNRPNFHSALAPLLSGVILTRAAELSYNLAITQGKVALIAPIAGSYPTLFAFLAFLVFKDPITKQQILGIITTLLGIVLLSFLSV